MAVTRRAFLHSAGSALWLSMLGSHAAGASAATGANQGSQIRLGLASYTTREFNLEETLAMTQQVGLPAIAFKSFHMALESPDAEIAKIADRTRKAGLALYGVGVIYMNTADEVRNAFRYAKAAAVETIIGVPAPALLALVEEEVKRTGIKVAIHNHGPGDKVYPTPQVAYERVADLDVRIGLCIDIGHTARSGIDPSEAARECRDRLLDVHLKDVTTWDGKGQTLEMGRGVIDIPAFMRTLKEIGYTGYASFEYEKDARAPLPGLAESVGYARGVLDTLA